MEVLLAVNGEDMARKTVEHAASAYPDASFTALHVLPQNTEYVASEIHIENLIAESDRRYAEELFETVSRTAKCNGIDVNTLTGVGSPVYEIVRYAENFDMDHVVIGSCGRTGLRRILYRNVTKGVVYRSPVPVTVVTRP
jgi:nucleotide-binding universal stress UspA family protein